MMHYPTFIQSMVMKNTSSVWLMYMWQSQVEIEHYSIAYFNHIIMFKVLYVTGSYVLCKCVRYSWVYTAHMSPTRMCYINMVMWSKYAME